MLRTIVVMLGAILGCTTFVHAQDASLTRPYSQSDCPSCAEWNEPSRAVHLFGNTYYVGTRGLASILIASPDGHVLIDGGLPDTAPLILQNVRALGFRASDIRIILNSHEHHDHAGGIAALQQVTGARVLASPDAAPVLGGGEPGPNDPQHAIALPMPAAANVEVVQPGDVVRLGSLSLTMHPTGGHTPGGTSWTWQSCEAERCLRFVYADSQTPVSADDYRFSDNPHVAAAFHAGQALLGQLPCDVLITPHPGASQFWQRMETAPEGLIDTTACVRYAAAAREQLRRRLERERS